MVDKNNDLRVMLIDAEIRASHTAKVAHQYGWLDDIDNNIEWPLKEYRLFLKCWLAYDCETRDNYIEFMRNPEKRREYGAENVADEKLDYAFFEKWFALCRERGGNYFEKKIATIYFANLPDVLAWYRDFWLNDDVEWRYEASRDDGVLAEILSSVELRVKAPKLVKKIFRDWVMPFLKTRSFAKANKRFGYDDEQAFYDIYARLFERKNGKNRIDYWIKNKPCLTLKEWVELEAWREIERTIRRLRRERLAAIYFWDKMELLGANAKSDENETAPEVQELFDLFCAVEREGAALLAAYYNSPLTFNELASLWEILSKGEDNNGSGKTLNKRHERAVTQWRISIQKALNVEIDDKKFKKIFRLMKREARTEQESEKEEKAPNFGDSPSENWKNNIRLVAEEPTREMLELSTKVLNKVLTNRRFEEIGGGWQLTFSKDKTQGGRLEPGQTDVALVRRRSGDPVERREKALGRSETIGDTPWQFVDEARIRAAGSPILIRGARAIRSFWRKKYNENDSVVFHFESSEPLESQTFWEATVKIPYDADRESEIGVVVDWRNKFNVAPVEFKWGKISAPIVCGVAKIKVGDFLVGVEEGAPSVTMKIRRLDENHWHVKHVSHGRLLFRKPVVRDDEER